MILLEEVRIVVDDRAPNQVGRERDLTLDADIDWYVVQDVAIAPGRDVADLEVEDLVATEREDDRVVARQRAPDHARRVVRQLLDHRVAGRFPDALLGRGVERGTHDLVGERGAERVVADRQADGLRLARLNVAEDDRRAAEDDRDALKELAGPVLERAGQDAVLERQRGAHLRAFDGQLGAHDPQ